MRFIPELRDTSETEYWSDKQAVWYVVCSYLIILAYTGVLILAIMNFCQFILATTQTTNAVGNKQCTLNHPLMVFYILVFFCMTTDILYTIFAVEMVDSYSPFLDYMPMTWKALIGIDQLWMMIEFIFHIRHSIQMSKAFNGEQIFDEIQQTKQN